MFWSQLPSGRWVNLAHVNQVVKLGEHEAVVSWHLDNAGATVLKNNDAHALLADLERLARRDQQSLDYRPREGR